MQNQSGVNLQFECICSDTQPEQNVWVVGNIAALGSWCLDTALKLETKPECFPTWRSPGCVRIPKGQNVEFKFVIMNQSKDYVVWEQIENRKISIDSPTIYRSRFGEWQSERLPLVSPSKTSNANMKLFTGSDAQTQHSTWMGRSPDTSASPLPRLASHADLLCSPGVSLSTSSLTSSSPFSVLSHVNELTIEEEACEKVQSKGDGREDASALSSSLRLIVDGEKRATSWKMKLELVKTVLTSVVKDGKLRLNPEDTVNLIDCLAYCSIYLRFISQGDIVCTEDGRHFRPNHHANLSRELFFLLEQVMQEMAMREDIMADAVRVLARSMAPSLPSFSASFTAAQPLTRIRDLAHRNDIPSELKNEIKHTIQNKLHRCAGPEDLITTEKLLGRIHSNRGAYPPDFIVEFERFYNELRRFFNATDLETKLHDLREQENPRAAELISRFLESKARSDDPNAGLTKMLVTLSVCVDLRSSFTFQLRDSGAGTHKQDGHQMQEMRLAEILMDDVAFVLLSRCEMLFEQKAETPWAEGLEALSLGIQNIRISGIRRDECRALSNDISALARQVFHSKDDYLILKATLDRCRRLCEDFSDMQTALFAKRTAALGLQLNLPEFALRVYAEAMIRSSVVFQVSKLCRALFRRIQTRLNLQPYETLVPGEGVGQVLLFDTLEEAVLHCARRNHSAASLCSSELTTKARQAFGGSTSAPRGGGRTRNDMQDEDAANGKDRFPDAPPLVLASRCANGDEELAGLDGPGGTVVGIVVGHDLPILSHLGVRARQKGVPFIACQEPSAFDFFAGAHGKIISLSADANSVSFEVLDGEKANEALQSERERGERVDERSRKSTEKYILGISTTSPSYPFSSLVTPSLLSSSSPPAPLTVNDIHIDTCGAKAGTCARLRLLAETAQLENERTNRHNAHVAMDMFEATNCLVLPYGTAEWLIQKQGMKEEFQCLMEKLETSAPGSELDSVCGKMKELIMHLIIPEEMLLSVVHQFGARSRLVVRSSANVEDLKGMSAAGLYESVANVSVIDPSAFQSAILTVWASLYSYRAVLARRAASVPQHQACMAVLIQELVNPELSFILHTVNPLENDAHCVYAEISPGLGETLAGAGTRGSPYRMVVDKATGEVTMLSFCNYSTSLVPTIPKNRSFTTLRDGKGVQQINPILMPSSLIRTRIVEYTMEPMTQNLAYRVHVGHRLAAISLRLEAELGGPQDVEGVVSGDAIWIVQSRPQPSSE